MLRTDGGGEYVSAEFNKFCDEQGIEHKVTFPYTPQHNGVAERKNRTIMNMMRSMLRAKGMPNSFWAEAVSCSVYLLNRSPTRSVSDITPVEAWSGYKPNVKHLKVFGSVAYAHVPAQTRTKLDNRGVKTICVGYKRGGYKLYNPVTNKVIVSRDVTFAEDEVWKWDGEIPDDSGRHLVSDLEEVSEVSTLVRNQEASPISAQEKFTPLETERPRRQQQPPITLRDFEVISDNAIDADGNYVHYAMFADCEPTTFEEANRDSKWVNAMTEEINAIERNDTWELTDIPQGHKAIDVKWVFKTKRKSDGKAEKHKARLVAKGYEQQPGYDYQEVFSPVARIETIRLIIALAAQNHWKVHQMDVKSAFLNGPLEEEIFVKQPPGFLKKGKEDKVYRLKKALYGLKQVPRAWNKCIDSFFSKIGFEKCPSEHSLYVKVNNSGDILLLCLYVDDLIFTSNNPKLVSEFKRSMMDEFEMPDLGLMSYYLGIEVVQREDGIFIS